MWVELAIVKVWVWVRRKAAPVFLEGLCTLLPKLVTGMNFKMYLIRVMK